MSNAGRVQTRSAFSFSHLPRAQFYLVRNGSEAAICSLRLSHKDRIASPGFVQKYRQVLLPVVAVSLGATLVYSALNWFLVQCDHLVPLDEDVANIWLPLAPLRRLDVMAFGAWGAIAAFFLTGASVMAPALQAQQYISRAAGSVTHVASAAAIASAPRTRFYASDSVCLDRNHAAAWPTIRRSASEDDEDLIVTLYVAVPVCGTADSPPRAVRYSPTWRFILF